MTSDMISTTGAFEGGHRQLEHLKVGIDSWSIVLRDEEKGTASERETARERERQRQRPKT
jgi:hypothetical protein